MEAAWVDPLTALPTRHALMERLRAESENGSEGSVGVLDIDHFKVINDQNGHLAGDVLLQVIARRLQAALPHGACLARFGGDEFAVFLPGLAVAEAKTLVEGLLDRLRQPVDLSPHGRVCCATASAGVVGFLPRSVEDTLRACDMALYAAKARGRDQVVVFDDETREVLSARRELAAAVMELQERNRALRDEARTDALTGLRNRLALDEVLDNVVGTGASPWAQVAVAFIDIDHFGSFNHEYGDAAGDEALRRVAAAIQSASRQSDLVFRKGGEEFVVVLVDTARDHAPLAAERIRAAVANLAIAHRGSGTGPVVSVTIGVATGEPGCTLRELMQSASDQVMQAKLHGTRHRILPVHCISGCGPGPCVVPAGPTPPAGPDAR